jgi:hypothetical protein
VNATTWRELDLRPHEEATMLADGARGSSTSARRGGHNAPPLQMNQAKIGGNRARHGR